MVKTERPRNPRETDIMAVFQELMSESGRSARNTAAAAGISQTRFHFLLHGEARLDIADFLNLCSVFEKDPVDVLKRALEKTPLEDAAAEPEEAADEEVVELPVASDSIPQQAERGNEDGSQDAALASAIAELSEVVASLHDAVVGKGEGKVVGIPELAIDAPEPVRTAAEQARIDSALAHPERAAASTSSNSAEAGLEEGSGA